MKKVLILGGNSDIGTKVVEKLMDDKDLLLSIHYSKFPPKINYKKKIKLIKKDLFNINEKNIKKVFKNDYDIIINLVGYVSNQSFLNFSLKEINKTILINSFIPFLCFIQFYLLSQYYGGFRWPVGLGPIAADPFY